VCARDWRRRRRCRVCTNQESTSSRTGSHVSLFPIHAFSVFRDHFSAFRAFCAFRAFRAFSAFSAFSASESFQHDAPQSDATILQQLQEHIIIISISRRGNKSEEEGNGGKPCAGKPCAGKQNNKDNKDNEDKQHEEGEGGNAVGGASDVHIEDKDDDRHGV
jgi:hypothetical protein